MKRSTMSFLLKLLLLFLVFLSALFFFWFLPFYGSELKQAMPEYSWAYHPCLAWAWCFAVPLYAASFPAWKIIGTISREKAAFSSKNAKRFKQIALCFCSSGFIFPIGMITLALMGAGSAPLSIVVTPLIFIGLNSISFVCYVMSRLVLESSEIKEENELTV